jgi:cytochrome c oxidase cbb3-type subunit 3
MVTGSAEAMALLSRRSRRINSAAVGRCCGSKDSAALDRGAAVFKQNCLACHGDRGQGVVGPNLTDLYYLHGAKAKDIYQVIGTGVLEKGMPAWRTVLGGSKVQEVTAFVLSLRGKNVSGKPPQGKTESGEAAPVQ